VKAFFDTNVIVYAFLDIEKRERALDALSIGGCISTQVLSEFTHVARYKRKREWQEIKLALEVIRFQFPQIQPLTAETHARGVALAERYSLSFYDSMIVAAALEAGCDTLLSEDMQSGLKIGSLMIINPFE
jgi:predicted nucleic acid-binding protein